jgi:hypothetical protein
MMILLYTSKKNFELIIGGIEIFSQLVIKKLIRDECFFSEFLSIMK